MLIWIRTFDKNNEFRQTFEFIAIISIVIVIIVKINVVFFINTRIFNIVKKQKNSKTSNNTWLLTKKWKFLAIAFFASYIK